MRTSKSTNQPTASELAILQILWKEGPSSVRTVHDILSENKESGYTTTLKLMQLMFEKGLLERESEGRKHIYRAAIEEETTQGKLLDQFLEKTFRGSAVKLVMRALGSKQTTQKELDEIKAYLNQIEKQTNDGSDI